MWILRKPSLTSAKRDIDILIQHCNNLNASHKPMLEQLYDEYDVGEGEVTEIQLRPLADKKNVIREQYKKTYHRDDGTGHLFYIRKSLMSKVQKCPYCSVNEPTQLDHYMDKGNYGQLATCRLNLVPLCGTCNWLKKDRTYKDFVHPYYQVLPHVPFLIANCKVTNLCVSASFSIDKSIITDVKLYQRMNLQMAHVHLGRRLKGCVQEFIASHFSYCNFTKDTELKAYLNVLLAQMQGVYEMNDWRTALVRGLMLCPQFNIAVVNNLKSKVTPINGIGA